MLRSYIHEQTQSSFHQRLERIQYKAVLVIVVAIHRTSKRKILAELGFETLQHRCCFRKLCCFYKIGKHKTTKIPF